MTKKANGNVRGRDARGRFAKKSSDKPIKKITKKTIEAVTQPIVEIVSPSSPPKQQPKVVKVSDLYKVGGAGKKPVYLKASSPTIPLMNDKWNYKLQGEYTFSHQLLMLVSAQDYGYGNSYLVFNPLKGNHDARYIPSDFQFLCYQEGDEGYEEMDKLFDSVRISSIYRNLHHTFRIGCDPEIFVEKEEGGMIPAFLFLPGKDNPARTPNEYANFASYGNCTMYWDGFQAEFTTVPQNCLGHHGDSIAAGLTGVYRAARKRFPGAKLSLRSVFYLDPDMLMTANEEHVAFGCMPSFNVYGLKVNMPPAREVPFRSAGGHIHFGTGRLLQSAAQPMVKALDAILGVACVSLFAEFDDPNRRKLYGLPGEYRLPPHGLEYRPLSNCWLSHPMIMNLVIDLARKCVVFGQNGMFAQYWQASEEETIDTIIRCDVTQAHKILDRNREIFKQLLKASYQNLNDESLEMLFDVFKKGIRSAVKDPMDFTSNWRLESGWIPHRGASGEPNVATFVSHRSRNPKHLA